jgi:hypothetical protein
MWLRLIPSFDPGKKWKTPELGKALNQGINLPTLIGPANSTFPFSLRCVAGEERLRGVAKDSQII